MLRHANYIVPVRRDENAFAAIPLLAHRVPEVFPGCGVQAGSWFVQEQDARIADHSYGCAEFPLVSTTKSTKTNTANWRLKSIGLKGVIRKHLIPSTFFCLIIILSIECFFD